MTGRTGHKAAPFTSAAADSAGYVWFGEPAPEGRTPLLRRARINFDSPGPIEPTDVPLPRAPALEAAGARACRELATIDQIVALADGQVWLRGRCTGGANALLRMPAR